MTGIGTTDRGPACLVHEMFIRDMACNLLQDEDYIPEGHVDTYQGLPPSHPRHAADIQQDFLRLLGLI